MIPPPSYDGACDGCATLAHLLPYTVEDSREPVISRRTIRLCRECRAYTQIFEVIRRVYGASWHLSL